MLDHVFLIVGIAFLLYGFCLAANAFWLHQWGNQSTGWQPHTGTVVSSKVISKKVEEPSIGGYGPWVDIYRADIRYRYVVSGKEYSTDRFDFSRDGTSSWTSRKDEAERLVESYAAGRQVNVYVSPRDPWLAVLKPGITPRWFSLAVDLICSAAFFGVGFWLIL